MTRLHNSVTQTLVQQAVDGELATGEWLPRELDLADRHGVSRGVAREAIQALRERGVVMVRHGRGAQLRPERDWNLLDPVVLRALVTADDRRDVLADLIECRRIVQPQAAALAAERASEQDAERLVGALQALRDAPATLRRAGPDEHPFVRAEIAFHATLAAIAGNRPLAKMLEPVDFALAVARHERAPERQAAVVRQHARIAAAVEARAPDDARRAVATAADQLRGWLVGSRRRS